MKKSIIISLMMVLAVTANAIPAKPGKMKLATKDGSTIEVTLVGDEFHHNYVTSDGFIVKQEENHDYFVVTDQRFDEAEAASIRMAKKANMPTRVNAPKSTTGTSAYTKGLVILVSFSDYAFTQTNAAFDSLLNAPGYSYKGATGSVKDYFNSVSYGNYNPTFDVYGPYTLPKSMSYYGSNSYGSDANAAQMIVDAVALLVQDQGQNVLAQYDCDNDRYVDNVFVFYAGYAESSGAPSYTIWPHRWNVSSYTASGTFTYGGKTIYDYACSSEMDGTADKGSKRTAIGAFCHEFSHVLGLPDLYDTYNTYSSNATPGEWDIMDAGCYNNNENTPPAYSSEERFYVGWLTPTIINSSGTYTLNNLNDSPKAYLISETGTHNLMGNNPNPKNYYLFENRQQKGWDKYIPGHGMLVWKIQYSSSKWEGNTVNNSSSSLGCTVVSAKNPNSFTGRSCSAADPFPGTKNVTSYTPYSNYALSGIKETNSVITFTVGSSSDLEDTSMADDIVMFTTDGEEYVIDSLPEGATLRCYDALGRLLWSAENVDATYTFRHTRGMFFVHVTANGKSCVLKGMN